MLVNKLVFVVVDGGIGLFSSGQCNALPWRRIGVASEIALVNVFICFG